MLGSPRRAQTRRCCGSIVSALNESGCRRGGPCKFQRVDERMLVALNQGETRRRTRWHAWRPLIAAAAGIVVGIFCPSVMFAYVAASLGKWTTFVLQESLDAKPAPLETGVPNGPGRWSGDYSQVVGREQGSEAGEREKDAADSAGAL